MVYFNFAFSTYAQQTPLHGFSFVAGSYRLLEQIFWAVLLLISFLMTLVQSVNLISYYRSEPSSTIVSPMINKTISLSRTTFCVENFWQRIDSSDLLKMRSSLNNLSEADLALLRNSSVDSPTPVLSTDIMTCTFSLFSAVTEAEWTFFDASYDYLSNLTDWKSDKVDGLTTPGFNSILNFFAERNVSMDKLWRSLVYSACRLMNLTATISVQNTDWMTKAKIKKNVTTIDICDPTRVTFIDEYSFCLKINSKLAKSSFKFSSPTDFVQISALFPQNWTSERLIMSVDLDGRDFLRSNAEAISINPGNAVTAYFGNQNRFDVSVDGDYQLYSSKRKPCIKDGSQMDCIYRCHSQSLVEVCKCWPLVFNRIRPDSIPLCIDTHNISIQPARAQLNFSSCLWKYARSREQNYKKELGDSQFLSECLNLCPINCRHSKYFFQDTGVEANDIYSYIQLSVTDFAYLNIQEVPSTSWETFLSDFGGIIGVWLGGSIVGFVHIPVYLGKLIAENLRRKKTRDIGTAIGLKAISNIY